MTIIVHPYDANKLIEFQNIESFWPQDGWLNMSRPNGDTINYKLQEVEYYEVVKS